MAAKLHHLLPLPLRPRFASTKAESLSRTNHPWRTSVSRSAKVRASLLQEAATSSSALLRSSSSHHLMFLADSVAYSRASYYTSLGLFVISVPGLWSLIKRSVKSKVRALYQLINYLVIMKCYCYRRFPLHASGFFIESLIPLPFNVFPFPCFVLDNYMFTVISDCAEDLYKRRN